MYEYGTLSAVSVVTPLFVTYKRGLYDLLLPPPFSGPATPSAINMLSNLMTWGSGGSSCSVQCLCPSPVFSFMSQRMLNNAGFSRWQLRDSFLAWDSSSVWLFIVNSWSSNSLMSVCPDYREFFIGLIMWDIKDWLVWLYKLPMILFLISTFYHFRYIRGCL